MCGEHGVRRGCEHPHRRRPTLRSVHARPSTRPSSTRRAFHFRFHAHLSEERRQPASSRVSTRGTQLQVSKNSLNGEEGGEGGGRACKNASCDEHGMPSFLSSSSFPPPPLWKKHECCAPTNAICLRSRRGFQFNALSHR